jgi:transporter family-2 protein
MPAPTWWLLALPFVAGACLPLQAGINGQLAKQVSSTLSALKGMTWWHWSGGLLGAFFIFIAAFAGPRIGALLLMALVLVGQLSMALTLDHFGWAGFREAPVSLGKIGGLLLIVAGIWLIRRG